MSKNRRGNRGKKRRIFPEEPYAAHEVHRAAEGVLEGVLRVQTQDSGDSLHAFIDARDFGFASDVYIGGFEHRNRAKHGDRVQVQLLAESEWRSNGRAEAEATRFRDKKAHRELEEALADVKLDGDDRWLTSADRAEAQVQEQDREWYQDEKQGNLWAPLVPPRPAGPVDRGLKLSEMGQRALSNGLQPAGRVVAILETAPFPDVPGHLHREEDTYQFIPDLGRHTRLSVPWERVPDCYKEDPERFARAKFLARQDPNWPAELPQPVAAAVWLLGEDGSIEVETIALLLEHKVIEQVAWTEEQDAANAKPMLPLFPQEAVDELERTFGKQWAVTDDDLRVRRDFRDERVFTIDPWSAKDLDDALHVKPLGDGTVEMGVHIADVTHFVREGSAVDEAARARATSVYLVNRVIHMLPKELSQDYCSLNPNVDRLTFSVVWRMQMDGNLVKDHEPWFGRGVIRSCCKLDYGTAQRMIDGTIEDHMKKGTLNDELWAPDRRPDALSKQSCEDVIEDVKLMHRVAMARRSLRKEKGAMQLHNAKLSFYLDSETQNPKGVTAYPIRDSNRLIEEYMLIANYLVAQQLIRALPEKAVLRRHRCPDLEELAKTNENIAKTFGVTIPGDTSADMSRAIAEIQEMCRSRSDQGSLTALLIMELCTMPMQLAQYCCYSCLPAGVSCRHFALNIPYYTHFTSPIRRYADVMVHRVLQSTLDDAYATTLDQQWQSLGPEELDTIAQHCNEKNYNAKQASRASDLLFLRLYVRRRPIVERAIVSGIGADSFQLSVPTLGHTTRIYARAPPLTDCFQSAPYNEAEECIPLKPRNGDKARAFLDKVHEDAENREHARFRGVKVAMFEQVWAVIYARVDRHGKECVDMMPLCPIPHSDRSGEHHPTQDRQAVASRAGAMEVASGAAMDIAD